MYQQALKTYFNRTGSLYAYTYNYINLLKYDIFAHFRSCFHPYRQKYIQCNQVHICIYYLYIDGWRKNHYHLCDTSESTFKIANIQIFTELKRTAMKKMEENTRWNPFLNSEIAENPLHKYDCVRSTLDGSHQWHTTNKEWAAHFIYKQINVQNRPPKWYLPFLCKTKEFFVELIYAGRS